MYRRGVATYYSKQRYLLEIFKASCLKEDQRWCLLFRPYDSKIQIDLEKKKVVYLVRDLSYDAAFGIWHGSLLASLEIFRATPFPDKQWADISPDAKILVSSLLSRNLLEGHQQSKKKDRKSVEFGYF